MCQQTTADSAAPGTRVGASVGRAGRGVASLAVLLVVLLLTCSCASLLPSSAYYQHLRYGPPASPPVAAYSDVTVYFVTNRQSVDRWPYFGADPAHDGSLAFGAMTVRVPKDRPMGGGDPFATLLDHSGDRREARLVGEPRKIAGIDAFLAELESAKAGKPLVVRVHGYNVDFPGSVVGTGVLVYDLGGAAVPIAFSWPAAGRFEQYVADENNAVLSGQKFAAFLNRLQDQALTSARPIHVLAHSMGSRVTLYAMGSLPAKPFLRTLNFAAPDVDSIEFQTLLPPVLDKKLAARTTTYVCQRDLALMASQRLHSRSPLGDGERGRAGQAGRLLVPVKDVETVDVSLVELSPTFHGYAGTNRTVLFDLYLSTIRDLPAEQRNLFAAEDAAHQRFWLIRP